jgi:hypothetical protein
LFLNEWGALAECSRSYRRSPAAPRRKVNSISPRSGPPTLVALPAAAKAAAVMPGHEHQIALGPLVERNSLPRWKG